MAIGHMGSVYVNEVYTPLYYLDALAKVSEPIRNQIETHFIGRVSREAAGLLERSGAQIRQPGFMPHRKALDYLRDEIDYALLIVGSKSAYSGKLFEYMASGKPILAITPQDGAIARLLRETGAGWSADPGDGNAIRDMLLRAFDALHEASFPVQRNMEAIRRFERPRLVAQLVRETGMVPEEANDSA